MDTLELINTAANWPVLEAAMAALAVAVAGNPRGDAAVEDAAAVVRAEYKTCAIQCGYPPEYQ